MKEKYACAICGEQKKERRYETTDGKSICFHCIYKWLGKVPDDIAQSDKEKGEFYTLELTYNPHYQKSKLSFSQMRNMIEDYQSIPRILNEVTTIWWTSTAGILYQRFCDRCGVEFPKSDESELCQQCKKKRVIKKKENPRTVILGDPQCSCTVNFERRLIDVHLGGALGLLGIDRTRTFGFGELHSYEYFENTESIIKGGSGLGRAIVGGLVFGGAGAIVGAITKKKKEDQVINDMRILMTFQDTFTGEVYTSSIGIVDTGWLALRRGTDKYVKFFAKIRTMLATLDEVYAIGHPKEQYNEQETEIVVERQSYTDELRVLKNLLDEGIITLEEFNAKKRKILGI